MVINFENRISKSKNYLKKLNKNLSSNWATLYSQFELGELDLWDKLSLIHPDFIRRLAIPVYSSEEIIIKQVQGNRSFSQQNGVCQAKLIWGYHCSLKSEACHGDHLFPYSLGGPTISDNKLLLCRYHNMVKGTDIHLLPWEEEYRFSWIDNYLKNFKNQISLYLSKIP